MIEIRELKFLKEKIESKKHRKGGSKILAKIFQQIKDSTNFEKNLDNRIGYDKTFSKYSKRI